MRSLVIILLFTICSSSVSENKQNVNPFKAKRILVFSKNGKGYVHENIPYSVAALQKLGKEMNMTVDTTTNSALFTDDNLKNYDAIIFSNTNNEVFDSEEQKIAFMHYIEAGGSFMGIHSTSGAERNWKWFKLMLGATFLRHPPIQSFTVHVLDKKHPAVKNLQSSWTTTDECYFFKEINPAIKVLLFSDISAIKEKENSKDVTPDVFGNRNPCCWCNQFDGGRIWYTSLGHDKNDYSNPTYLALLTEGLKWLLDKEKLDYKKAYATSSTIDEMKFLEQ